VATFRLVLPRAPWTACLEELRQCYSDAIRKAGHAVTLSDTYLNPGEAGEDYQCAFGAHSVTPPDDFDRMVVMQSEHHAHHFRTEYIQTLGRARLIVNMGPFTLPGLGGLTPSVEVPPGVMRTRDVHRFSPFVRDAAAIDDWLNGGEHPQVKRDIDVLFYGSVTPRRAQMLESLSKAGVHVTALYGVLGAKRDAYIDRAKVVLDLKQDGTEPDDQTRVFWSLSRGACTLSENAHTGLLAHITPETIVSSVQTMLSSEEWRRRAREQYTTAIGSCDVSPMLRALGL